MRPAWIIYTLIIGSLLYLQLAIYWPSSGIILTMVIEDSVQHEVSTHHNKIGAYKSAATCIKPGTSWGVVTMLVLIVDTQRWNYAC
jgi:hypothetical protein